MMRLGHALDDVNAATASAVLDAVKIAQGELALQARPTQQPAVHAAENALGADPRPVYAYVGNLHPELGSVGLIVDRDWAARCVQGVSRCDSGGLTGGFGGFCCVPEPDRVMALLAVSFGPEDHDDWEAGFDDEVATSYLDATEYVGGAEPDTSSWTDIRAVCLEYAHANSGLVDRRLWTWEARMTQGPDADEVRFIALSPRSRATLEELRRAGEVEAVPAHVRLLVGSVSEMGVHHFNAAGVLGALAGDVL